MSIRILLVDDEQYNLDILRIYFKSMNYEIYEAVCGQDAMRMVEKINPDLILLDVMLPDISGYDVCKKLNEHADFDTPIIFLSANTQKNAILKGLELGVFDYLTKPFDLELLEKKVKVALQHRINAGRKLNQHLELVMEQARTDHTPLCFMILQIDQSEMIYDSLGQRAFDSLIQALTAQLKQSGVNIHTVSRQGSDKLLAILPNRDQVQDIGNDMETIIHKLTGQPYMIEQSEIFVTTTIGISMFPHDGDEVQTLIKNADMAMHTAKKTGGGNSFKFYTSNMDDSLARRIRLESRLRRALERNELSLHYQPKINIQTGKLMGTEALLRWQNDELGNVSPVEFIPIAEETGLIASIGRWVLQTACQQNKKWNDAGFCDLTVAVNLSARQFESHDLLKSVIDTLKKTGLNPKLLELEITEGILMQNAAATVSILNELKGMGISISVDDFGTGFSSLSYLRKFPINCLKIDRSFIKEIEGEQQNSEITNAIISLAHTLNLKVIAEGVETKQQLDYLINQRCDEVQGYYFSKPLPAAAFDQYLSNHYHYEMLG